MPMFSLWVKPNPLKSDVYRVSLHGFMKEGASLGVVLGNFFRIDLLR